MNERLLVKNKETTFILSRLREYITLADACKYIGIQVIDLRNVKNAKPVTEKLPEGQRDLTYHLGKIKFFLLNKIDEPIDIDCLVRDGRTYPIPIIMDGRHRYIAALLRNDEKIAVTFSGLLSVYDYLSGITNKKI